MKTKKLIMFVIFCFFLTSTVKAKTSLFKEIIPFSHLDAQKKCEMKAKKIQKDNFLGVNYKKTGETRYVSRYRTDCEESLCQVQFKQKSWKYEQAYLVCNLPMPKDYEVTQQARLKQRRLDVAKIETSGNKDLLKAANERYLVEVGQKVLDRQPASVKASIKKPKDNFNQKLSCQEYVKDLNDWILNFKSVEGELTKKNEQGLLPILFESVGTSELVEKFIKEEKADKLQTIKNSLELVKVKLQVLEKQTPRNEALLLKNTNEYNQLVQSQYQYYLKVGHTYCYNELIDNHSQVLGQIYQNNLENHREEVPTKSKSYWDKLNLKERTPAQDLILEE